MRALLSPDGSTSKSTASDTTNSTPNIETQDDDEAGFVTDIVTSEVESECSGCVRLKRQVLRLQKKVSYLKKRRYQLISSIQKVIGNPSY